MGRPQDVARLVRAGMTPREIANELQLTEASVAGYLHRAVGEGGLRRSDVYFSVSSDRRRLDPTIRQWFSDPAQALGDLYEDLRQIEVTLHGKIASALAAAYNDNHDSWWRQGVPESVRVKCQERRERDSEEPCEPFAYSDLIDLDATFESQWKVLSSLVPDYGENRKALSKDLRRLNRIRNKVMHPVRGFVPDESDFDFVRHLQRSLGCEARKR